MNLGVKKENNVNTFKGRGKKEKSRKDYKKLLFLTQVESICIIS